MVVSGLALLLLLLATDRVQAFVLRPVTSTSPVHGESLLLWQSTTSSSSASSTVSGKGFAKTTTVVKEKASMAQVATMKQELIALLHQVQDISKEIPTLSNDNDNDDDEYDASYGSMDPLLGPESSMTTRRRQELQQQLITAFGKIETLVNALEDVHEPFQTVPFFNLVNSGADQEGMEWQCLFSTSANRKLLRSTTHTTQPSTNMDDENDTDDTTRQTRITNVTQRVQVSEDDPMKGEVITTAVWESTKLVDQNAMTLTGDFTVRCSYRMPQVGGGARMVLELQGHTLQPHKQQSTTTIPIQPSEVPALVGQLHQELPKELFDPTEHQMDTTYLDGDLKIVRYTGPQFEGVRDIFVRTDFTMP